MTKSMAVMVWMAAAAGAHAGQPEQKLTVYLLETASVPNDVRFLGKTMAGQMFARIGITVEWGKGEPPVASSLEPPIVIELATHVPAHFKPGVLAYALPYEGAHITVFYDRIQYKPQPGALLAHVMVHEITHLLQAVNRHSDEGIMKAVWTSREFCAMRSYPLRFTEEDVELIYLGMARRERMYGVVARR
jgi:hypothetical protein